MADGRLGRFHKRAVGYAVAANSGSPYMLEWYTTALRRLGADDRAFVEMLAVVDYFNNLNSLADGMDILNMSIGSSFQWPSYPTAVAASNLVDAGMIVVASIGNSGANGAYSTGARASVHAPGRRRAASTFRLRGAPLKPRTEPSGELLALARAGFLPLQENRLAVRPPEQRRPGGDGNAFRLVGHGDDHEGRVLAQERHDLAQPGFRKIGNKADARLFQASDNSRCQFRFHRCTK